ncbi:TPA: hypothetical protein EYN23_02275, partial [Candidatus Poribacteria bacterium]|nr:hypothetical protein [Candidatus Poribacteria bacterium]
EKIATEMIESFTEPCWLFVWAEDDCANKIAVDAGFNWIGTKVTTFAELYAIYFKEAKNTLFDGPRRHPPRLSTEDCSIEKANLGSFDIHPIAESVSLLDTKYTNHYSNYNKGESWAALSLRGYSDDPAFITKPIEMSKKWQIEHIKEEFSIQDTALRKKLPEVENLLTLFPGRLHRVRLMSLSPGGGELKRHTDQVDPDTGVQNGNVMRFHFPLVTNEEVSFTSWQVSGKKKTVHMKTGECWYLDTRKPHQAINNGDTNRIHLVVDVEVNEEVRELVRNVVSG